MKVEGGGQVVRGVQVNVPRSPLVVLLQQRTVVRVGDRDHLRRPVARGQAAQIGAHISLLLYDVTTWYFETDTEDGLRKVGFSKERISLDVDAAPRTSSAGLMSFNGHEGLSHAPSGQVLLTLAGAGAGMSVAVAPIHTSYLNHVDNSFVTRRWTGSLELPATADHALCPVRAPKGRSFGGTNSDPAQSSGF